MSETLLAVIIGGAISAATAAIGQLFQMKMLDAKQHKELAFKLMDKRLEVYEHLFELLDVGKFIQVAEKNKQDLKLYAKNRSFDLMNYRGRYTMFASDRVIDTIGTTTSILIRIGDAVDSDIENLCRQFVDSYTAFVSAVRKETEVQIVDTLHKSIAKITDPKTHRTHDSTDNKTRNDGTH